MKTLQFKCRFLTDIVLSKQSATETLHTSLDFIPGSNFLGIVASQIYTKVDAKTAHTLFHSGEVIFGDAHLAYKNQRTLHMPAIYFTPKIEKEKSYNMALLTKEERQSKEIRAKQLKQERNGYISFEKDENKIYKCKIEKDFVIKSAYDANKRRSEDAKMYSYEFINKGTEFYFYVQFIEENIELEEMTTKALVGKKHLGRSRSSQFGLVEIEKCERSYQQNESNISKNETAFVYAESRLIFLDPESTLPTYQPTIEQLGFDTKAEIDYELSQIRTFQYSPYNFKRQAFDTDRCGIEKGSVFVIKLNGSKSPSISTHLGEYKNEGFGKVIYNPNFLLSKNISIKNIEEVEKDKENNKTISKPNTILIKYLENQANVQYETQEIYNKVNEFTKKHKERFVSEQFASQWGMIRNIASLSTTYNEMYNLIFAENTGYLKHGISKEKWEGQNRVGILNNLLEDNKNHTFSYNQQLLINLASEMAKKCREAKK